jgi:hypothetical protein
MRLPRLKAALALLRVAAAPFPHVPGCFPFGFSARYAACEDGQQAALERCSRWPAPRPSASIHVLMFLLHERDPLRTLSKDSVFILIASLRHEFGETQGLGKRVEGIPFEDHAV